MTTDSEHGPGCECRGLLASANELVARAKAERLRVRRQVVADLTAQGWTTRRIAEHLGVSAMEASRLLRD